MISRPRYNKKKQRKAKKNGEKFKRGFFTDISEKYQQPKDKYMNSQPFPEYRSSWELAFMKFLEKDETITMWGSESFYIPYISPKDGKEHRYFIDFMFIKNGKKFLVEIKPFNQLKSKINQAKFEAAEEYAKKIDAKFLVITEKELKSWNLI